MVRATYILQFTRPQYPHAIVLEIISHFQWRGYIELSWAQALETTIMTGSQS